MVAAIVVATDVIAMPILTSYPGQAPATTMLSFDFASTFLPGLAGVYISRRIGYPLWWRKGDRSPASRRATLITALLGFTVIAANTCVYLTQEERATDLAPWLALLTPETAIAISVRAALTEEVFFRLFLFPSIAWIFWRFTKQKEASLVIGALASTLAFGLIHPGFLWAFLTGMAILHIYHRRGLLPAMITHFLADAIPFTLISLGLI